MLQPSKLESSRTEDLLLSKEALERYDNECTDVYFLSQREISVLLSSLRYADWEARWKDRIKDAELIETLKRKLLMLCSEDIVKSQLLLLGAITGRSIPLSDPAAIEAMLNTDANFSTDGLVPVILTLAGATGEDYTDELLAIGSDLVSVAGILGAIA